MKSAQLKDICEIITRGISPKYTDETSGLVVLNQRCIRNHKISYEFSRRHDSALKPVSQTKLLKPGDILINSTGQGTLGRTALVNDVVSKMSVDSHITIIRTKPGLFIPRYLAYLFSMCEDDFIGMATGTSGQTELPRASIGEYVIHYDESLDEQKEIVRKLDAAFEKINLSVDMTDTSREDTLLLFDNVTSALLRADSSLWIQKKIGEVCELAQGLAINAKTKHLLVQQSSLPLLRIKDLRSGSAEQFVDEENFPKKALVMPDDLIYTRTGQIGLVFRNRYGILHNNSFKISPDSTLSKNYLYWWLQDKEFRKNITKLASRAAQPDITHKIFKDQNILIPPLDVQESISSKIEIAHTNTTELVHLYDEKMKNLRALKKSMLLRTFSSSDVK